MNYEKMDRIFYAGVAAVAAWVAGNMWEGRRTDRVCEMAYDLVSVARLNADRRRVIEERLTDECEPAELSSSLE